MAEKNLNQGGQQFTGVLEKCGILTTDRYRSVDQAREFYEKLHSSDRPDPEPDPQNRDLRH